MVVVEIPSAITYSNIYSLTGFTTGSSLVITNNTATPLFVVAGSSPPLAESDQYPIIPGETLVFHGNGDPIWIRGGKGPVIVQNANARVASPFTGADLPHDFYTSPKELYRRIKVDPGQTSFHDGREARTFYEFSIASGTSLYLQANVNVNTILYDVSTVVDAGSIRLTTYAGATGVGTYNITVPVLPKNTMSLRSTPFYTPVNTVLRGGTGISGGTAIDVVRVVAANATAQQTSVGSKAFDQRGVGVGTYYWRIENFGSGTATGVFSGFWAELLNLGV